MGDASDVIALAAGAGWRVGCAESVTGGMVASALVSVAGASSVFRGSVVAYDARAKTTVLGVRQSVLDAHGPVSEQVASAMAHGALALLDVEVAVATTGVAGPDAHGGQRPGTVVIAVVGLGADEVRAFEFGGDRGEVRQQAADAAVRMLVEHMRVGYDAR